MKAGARGRPRSIRKAAAATVILLASAGSAVASMCAAPGEGSALAARVVQTELMVAALSCGEQGRYNAFVRKFEDELVVEGRTLRQFFQRTYGKDATRQLNGFVTKLANEASYRSVVQGGDYCTGTKLLFAQALATDRGDLKAFLARHPLAAAHGVEPCGGDAVAVPVSLADPAGTR